MEHEYATELQAAAPNSVVLECGCGVGNTIFPLLEWNPHLKCTAFDFAPSAIELVHQQVQQKQLQHRVHAFVWDLSSAQPIPDEHVPNESIAFVTCIFVLSALAPNAVANSIALLSKKVQKNGMIFVRDYSIHDMALERFAKERDAYKKMGENWYVRGDGTQAVFFSLEQMQSFFPAETWQCVQCEYVERSVVNRQEQLHLKRIFVHGKFVKK